MLEFFQIVGRIMSSCELDPTLEPPAEELPATTPVVAPANLSLKGTNDYLSSLLNLYQPIW